MSEICNNHTMEPVKIYRQCIGCEIEYLRYQVRYMEGQLRCAYDDCDEWKEKALNKDSQFNNYSMANILKELVEENKKLRKENQVLREKI